MGWVRRQIRDLKARGLHGEWVDGAFEFPPNSQPRVSLQAPVPIAGAPGSRAAALFGRQWAQPEVPAAVCWYDPHGVMCFWADQTSPLGLRVKL